MEKQRFVKIWLEGEIHDAYITTKADCKYTREEFRDLLLTLGLDAYKGNPPIHPSMYKSDWDSADDGKEFTWCARLFREDNTDQSS